MLFCCLAIWEREHSISLLLGCLSCFSFPFSACPMPGFWDSPVSSPRCSLLPVPMLWHLPSTAVLLMAAPHIQAVPCAPWLPQALWSRAPSPCMSCRDLQLQWDPPELPQLWAEQPQFSQPLLPLIELQEVPACPFLQPVQVPLHSCVSDDVLHPWCTLQ